MFHEAMVRVLTRESRRARGWISLWQSIPPLHSRWSIETLYTDSFIMSAISTFEIHRGKLRVDVTLGVSSPPEMSTVTFGL